MSNLVYESTLYHHGIKGQKWGVRRFQNKDGTYTSKGKSRRNNSESFKVSKSKKLSPRAKKIAVGVAVGATVTVGLLAIYGNKKYRDFVTDAARKVISKNVDRESSKAVKAVTDNFWDTKNNKFFDIDKASDKASILIKYYDDYKNASLAKLKYSNFSEIKRIADPALKQYKKNLKDNANIFVQNKKRYASAYAKFIKDTYDAKSRKISNKHAKYFRLSDEDAVKRYKSSIDLRNAIYRDAIELIKRNEYKDWTKYI